jgi:hypothetical protein
MSVNNTSKPVERPIRPIRPIVRPVERPVERPIVRPDFMTPKPTSPKHRHSMSGSKRTFSEAFDDDEEEEHYGQKIGTEFFATNIGHSVVQSGHDSGVIEDFLGNEMPRRERDCEEKYDIDELLEWCDFYRNNRNLFNV